MSNVALSKDARLAAQRYTSVAALLILKVSASKDAGVAAHSAVQHVSQNHPAIGLRQVLQAASFAS